MTRRPPLHEVSPAIMIAVSLLGHILFYALFARLQLAPLLFPEDPVYYVDMVNLPVAEPRQGEPAPTAGPPATAPLPPPAPSPPTMPLPTGPAAKTAQQKPVPAPATQPAKPQAEIEDFNKRLSDLKNKREAQEFDDALTKARDRLAGQKAPVGMPKGTGTQAGSDYGSYLQSRLKDAFVSTISFQTKKPEVVVRLTIDRTGAIRRQRIERSTGDPVFEAAVFRAISLASKNFPPPPKGEEFEQGFIFRPQGVGKE